MKAGDRAPDFSGLDQNGRPVVLAELLARGPVVLFFYPKDGTPLCTAEACGFRDAYAEFASKGAQVVGVSADGPESHLRFAGRHSLPYPLLSDRDGTLRRLYEVPKTLGILPGRATYVIGRDGTLLHVASHPGDVGRHVADALGAIG